MQLLGGVLAFSAASAASLFLFISGGWAAWLGCEFTSPARRRRPAAAAQNVLRPLCVWVAPLAVEDIYVYPFV